MADANDRPRQQWREGTGTGNGTIDASVVAALYDSHATELRRFVLGVTRDPDLTSDVLQAAFAKAVEFGHEARPETFKGWLFRVAFHEALTARRRRETRDQGFRKLAELGRSAGDRPDENVMRGETVEAVRNAVEKLPLDQRRVVLARIYDDKTFAEIAHECNLPLGTVLTRMRLALEKLRHSLRPGV